MKVTFDNWGKVERKYLRANEVAKIFSVSDKTVGDWAKQGLLPFVHLGKSKTRHFSVEGVEAFAASLEQQQTEE